MENNNLSFISIKEKMDEEIVKQIRGNAKTGRPSGGDKFIKKIEKKT